MYIIGGCDNRDIFNATTFYDSIIKLNIKTGKWEEFHEAQLSLAGHSVSHNGSIIYISGGYSSNSQDSLNHSLFSLNTETMECNTLIPNLEDTPHKNHPSAIISKTNILFFACKTSQTIYDKDETTTKNENLYFNMIHLYNIKSNKFLKLPTMSSTGSFPPFREYYSAIQVLDKVFLFGGIYNSIIFDDLWVYDAKANSWNCVFPSGHTPTPRYLHSSCVKDNEFLIFGGFNSLDLNDPNTISLNDFYGLDTKQMRWVKYNFNETRLPPHHEGLYSLFCADKKIYSFGSSKSSFLTTSQNLIQLSDSFFHGSYDNTTLTPVASNTSNNDHINNNNINVNYDKNNQNKNKNITIQINNNENDHLHSLRSKSMEPSPIRNYSSSSLSANSSPRRVSPQSSSTSPSSQLTPTSSHHNHVINTNTSPTTSSSVIVPTQRSKKRKSSISSSTGPMSTLKKLAVSNLSKDLDDNHHFEPSNDSEHLHTELLNRSLAPIRRINKNRKVNEMIEIAFELEDYSDTLCQDVLHFISILNPLLHGQQETTTKEENNNTEDENNLLKQQIQGMCQDLYHFIEEQKPKIPNEFQSGYTKPKPIKPSKSSLISNTNQTIKNSCTQHYESLTLPSPYQDELKPPEFASFSKNLQTRFHIVNEILSTETEYVRDLGAIIGIFMLPLKNELKEFINQYDLNSLFKNLESLFDVNKSFLQKLIEECKKLPKEQDIGGVFLSFMENFRKYLVYCANQIAAGETLSRLEKENFEFSQFLDVCLTLPPSKNQSLDSFIIKPFQRICRYPLLLKELRKNTPPDWPFFGNLSLAISEINVIVQAANDSKKHTDSLVEIMEIQNQFIIGTGDTDLMQMHRWTFIKDASFRVVEKQKKISSKTFHFVLFSEVLIIAQPKGKKLQRIYSFPTENILIFDSNERLKGLFTFSIVNITNNAKVDVACSSQETKDFWVSTINKCGSVDD